MNGIRVLVVDDNSRHVETVISFLQGLLAVNEVVHSYSSQQVVANYADYECDIIVMETSIDDMNGFDATKQLRASGCRIPIFLLSTHAELIYHERARNAGANSLLWKYDFGEKIAPQIEMIARTKNTLDGRCEYPATVEQYRNDALPVNKIGLN